MANGTIAFDTLQTSGQITGTAKSVDTDYIATGVPKAQLMFDHIDTQIDGSLNISGVTDDGTGEATPAFTSNISLGFATNATSSNTSSGQNDTSVRGGGGSVTTQLTTSYKVFTFKSTSSYDDQLQASITVGDLV